MHLIDMSLAERRFKLIERMTSIENRFGGPDDLFVEAVDKVHDMSRCDLCFAEKELSRLEDLMKKRNATLN